MKPLSLVLLLLLVPAVAALAQPSEQRKPGDVMIEQYLAAKTDELRKKELDGATTLQEWQERRPRLYREYLYMLGLWPLPEKTPLKATITGTLEHDGVVIDKLHFQSRPGLYVTGNLYRPAASRDRKVPEKLPTILYVCGHSNRGRDGNKSAHQHHGVWFAKHGYNCLIVDSLQLGEIPGVHHGTYGRPYGHLAAYGIKDKKPGETRWWWHARGYTPAGVECWNGIRAIDYLVSRPDVDPERIGVTGISGGGAATFWITAADDRVKCAVPVSGLSDLESYVKNKVINGHCDCMFLYNTFGWEWTTIAALVAPRPLLFANSDNDKIFPMDGNRRVIARLRKLYGMYGKPELVDEYVSKGGHEDRPDLRVAAFKWMNKHLKNDTTTPIGSVEFKPLAGKALRAFPEDKDIPADQINTKVDETFVPKALVNLPEAGKFADWRARLVTELRERSFRSLPKEIPAARIMTRKVDAKGKVFELQMLVTEPGIEVEDLPVLKSGAIRTLSVEPEEPQSKPPDLRMFLGGKNSFALFPRGSVGSMNLWTRKSPPNYVARAHALLGQTVDVGRVRDIIATFKHLHAKEKVAPQVLGVGQAGILAAYAALFEPSINEVVVIDPPKSHKEGPYFLNVMRVLDIPDALGLLAPNVRLTLINARDPAFDRTEQIYRLAGAADKLTRK
jgi:cephalosporin-C deacetylase-like acetyl esterase